MTAFLETLWELCFVYFITLLVLFFWLYPDTYLSTFLSKLGNFGKCYFIALNKSFKHGLFWKKSKVTQIALSFQWESRRPRFSCTLNMIICCKCQVNSTHGYDPFTYCLIHSISLSLRNDEPWITIAIGIS